MSSRPDCHPLSSLIFQTPNPILFDAGCRPDNASPPLGLPPQWGSTPNAFPSRSPPRPALQPCCLRQPLAHADHRACAWLPLPSPSPSPPARPKCHLLGEASLTILLGRTPLASLRALTRYPVCFPLFLATVGQRPSTPPEWGPLGVSLSHSPLSCQLPDRDRSGPPGHVFGTQASQSFVPVSAPTLTVGDVAPHVRVLRISLGLWAASGAQTGGAAALLLAHPRRTGPGGPRHGPRPHLAGSSPPSTAVKARS